MFRYLILALAACTLLAAPAEALAARTGVVDVEKVLTDSSAAKAANEHLAKVQAVLQKGFADLEKRVAKAKKDERERELEAGRRVLERQMQIELAAARAVARDTERSALAPNRDLFSVPSRSHKMRSISACSEA